MEVSVTDNGVMRLVCFFMVFYSGFILVISLELNLIDQDSPGFRLECDRYGRNYL